MSQRIGKTVAVCAAGASACGLALWRCARMAILAGAGFPARGKRSSRGVFHKAETQKRRIVVGMGEAFVERLAGEYFDVGRCQEAVQRDDKGGFGIVGRVGQPAGGGVAWGVKGDAFRQEVGREGLRPGVIRAGIAKYSSSPFL